MVDGGHIWWIGGWGTYMVDRWMGDIYGGWVDRGTCMVDGWIGGHVWWMGG